jgi:hypothetical protein
MAPTLLDIYGPQQHDRVYNQHAFDATTDTKTSRTSNINTNSPEQSDMPIDIDQAVYSSRVGLLRAVLRQIQNTYLSGAMRVYLKAATLAITPTLIKSR